ncbi:MAG: ribonuclease P protein component [Acidocella sp.]|nr:ribonuclease P protein component [Acidocella sp.]
MAILTPPETLKRRANFLRVAATAQKFARPGFVMQFTRSTNSAPVKVGYTATRKLGGAVTRNRAKRRLREAARLTLAGQDLAGIELVLICRQDTATVDFSQLCASLDSTLRAARRHNSTS